MSSIENAKSGTQLIITAKTTNKKQLPRLQTALNKWRTKHLKAQTVKKICTLRKRATHIQTTIARDAAYIISCYTRLPVRFHVRYGCWQEKFRKFVNF